MAFVNRHDGASRFRVVNSFEVRNARQDPVGRRINVVLESKCPAI
jgi:hypothetical protein